MISRMFLERAKRQLLVGLVAILVGMNALMYLSTSASAWVLQAPSEIENVSKEDVQKFEEASRQVLFGAMRIYDALHTAEAKQVRIPDDTLAEVAKLLGSSAELFDQLGKSSLDNARLDWDSFRERVPELRGEPEWAAQLFGGQFSGKYSTGADLARLLAEAVRRAQNQINRLMKSALSPENPADAQGRAALQSSLIYIFVFARVANAGAVALALGAAR